MRSKLLKVIITFNKFIKSRSRRRGGAPLQAPPPAEGGAPLQAVLHLHPSTRKCTFYNGFGSFLVNPGQCHFAPKSWPESSRKGGCSTSSPPWRPPAPLHTLLHFKPPSGRCLGDPSGKIVHLCPEEWFICLRKMVHL